MPWHTFRLITGTIVEYRRAMAAFRRYEALKRGVEVTDRRYDVPRRIFEEFYSDVPAFRRRHRGLHETFMKSATRTRGQRAGIIRPA
jgi:hypothetical protein